MASSNNNAALRKRQQIDSSKRTMFIVVAVTAFASGIALVVAFFLVQQILFHGKVISAKQETINTIKANIQTADELKDNVRALDTNQALNSVKLNDDSSALQSILDALPSEANTDALGASLQVRFVGTIEDLRIENLIVDTVDEEEAPASEGTASAAEDGENSQSSEEGEEGTGPSGPYIGFSMNVSGSAAGLKELLTKLERSIRVVEFDSIEVEAGDNRLVMKLSGRAYYQPAQTVELGEKVVKP